MSDEWINVNTEGKDGTGDAVAGVLEAVAEALHEAPEEKRYDFILKVVENE